MHGLVLDLLPGGSGRRSSLPTRAARILRGRTAEGRALRASGLRLPPGRLASEVLRDVRTLDRKIADLNARIEAEVEASAPPSPRSSAWVHTGRDDLGHWSATWHASRPRRTSPPTLARRLWRSSSGKVVRHRLSLAGNRKLNYALHMVATSQARSDAPGGTYYRKKIDEGKSRKEALRCLKRRVCDAVFRSLLADSQAPSRSAA